MQTREGSRPWSPVVRSPFIRGMYGVAREGPVWGHCRSRDAWVGFPRRTQSSAFWCSVWSWGRSGPPTIGLQLDTGHGSSHHLTGLAPPPVPTARCCLWCNCMAACWRCFSSKSPTRSSVCLLAAAISVWITSVPTPWNACPCRWGSEWTISLKVAPESRADRAARQGFACWGRRGRGRRMGRCFRFRREPQWETKMI